MPLRDHFRPPVEREHSWDELHGMWPAVIVQQLYPLLPAGYVAAPRVHLGAAFEIDVSTHRRDVPTRRDDPERGGVATLPWAPPRPTLTLETDLADQDEYEVRLYDARHGRRLVAAIEIVSPSNKDRPESRRAFVAKVATLLRAGVCVTIIDVVTIRHFNLYGDLLDLMGGNDPMLGSPPSPIYAVTARTRRPAGRSPVLEAWNAPMGLGLSLPTLPIWLDDELGVSLDLEAGYEEVCRLLHIA